MKIVYKNSILEEEGEECPPSAIMRYYLDRDTWVDVTPTERGVEIRTNGGNMAIEPLSGNNVEVYVRERSQRG